MNRSQNFFTNVVNEVLIKENFSDLIKITLGFKVHVCQSR